MAALNRDSVLSTTSTGSVETPSMRPMHSVDQDQERPETIDYASTEAILNEQIGLVTKNRRKIKRLKTNFFILIVFLVNFISSHII